MKIKTSELQDKALDWAVAKCKGFTVDVLTVDEQKARYLEGGVIEELQDRGTNFSVVFNTFRAKPCIVDDDGYKRPLWTLHYSADWSQGGPIIEQEEIELRRWPHGWCATIDLHEGDAMVEVQHGPTPLVAAMRCFVASQLGDEIEIPEELL